MQQNTYFRLCLCCLYIPKCVVYFFLWNLHPCVAEFIFPVLSIVFYYYTSPKFIACTRIASIVFFRRRNFTSILSYFISLKHASVKRNGTFQLHNHFKKSMELMDDLNHKSSRMYAPLCLTHDTEIYLNCYCEQFNPKLHLPFHVYICGQLMEISSTLANPSI